MNKIFRGENNMDLKNAQIDINSYVAKYMDENGCDFYRACEELQIDKDEVFNMKNDKDIS